NFVFSCDFKEMHRLRCSAELQLKDAADDWIQFTNDYRPGSDGWVHISASLDAFGSPSFPPTFDPGQVDRFVVNIRMLETNAIYEGRFDNIQFTGPRPFTDDFEDRIPGENYSRILPWIGYGYDSREHDDVKLNEGVTLDESTDGSQSAFLVAQYRT